MTVQSERQLTIDLELPEELMNDLVAKASEDHTTVRQIIIRGLEEILWR